MKPGFWTRFGPALLTLVLGLAYVGLILATHQGDPMAFVRLGTRYGQGDPAGTIGYDGQFAYQIARRPLDAAPYLDIPAYRYQRLLYPLLGRWLSLGRPGLIPWVFIGLNLLALSGGVYVAGRLLARNRLSRWYALPVGLFAGQLVSLRLDLNEPLALTLALLAVAAFARRRPRWGAAWLALSMLSKETAILFVGGYLLYFFLTARWRRLLETALISLGPFALLQGALWLWLGQPGLRSGGQGATGFSLIPFGGLLSFALNDTATLLTVLLVLGPLILLPCLALIYHLVRRWAAFAPTLAAWREALSPVALILALHLLLMATLPFSTYVDLPGVLRLTSGLVVATVIYAAQHRQRRMLQYSQLWLAANGLLVFIG